MKLGLLAALLVGLWMWDLPLLVVLVAYAAATS